MEIVWIWINLWFSSPTVDCAHYKLGCMKERRWGEKEVLTGGDDELLGGLFWRHAGAPPSLYSEVSDASFRVQLD